MGKLSTRFLLLANRVGKQDIVRVFSFTAISTIVRMCTGLISVKVIAIVIGPVGVALLGQLNNFSTIVMSLAGGGINNGITKYVAEYKFNDIIKSFLSTALKITLFCSFVVSILLIVFHQYLSVIILQSNEYKYVFIILGLTVSLYALNMMLVSIVNGYKEFKKYVLISIVGSVVGLLFTLCFVLIMGLKGALISVVTFQSAMFFVTFWMLRKSPWFSWDYFKLNFDKLIARKYFHYTLMAFVTALTAPISQIILRGYVMSDVSVVEAGWWEGMNRIANMYLLVVTTSFSVYYLPKLSELENKIQIRNEILKAYKVIIPLLLISFFLIYILRFVVIRILFTSEFLPMEQLFIWQLMGDIFKISSWLLAFLMIAKSMTKAFIITEMFFSALYVGLGFWFISFNGIIGVTQAYMVNYILYFLTMVCLFSKILFPKKYA